jgi:multisubunit Na+/H+ antiporter MnhC subunit
MTELYLLSGLLVASGLYISYQWATIRKYRATLTIATYALEAAYDTIMEKKNEDD